MSERVMQDSAAAAFDLMGLLFACDPVQDERSPELFAQVAAMDVELMSSEWPFVDPGLAKPLLEEMKRGASGDLCELAREYRRLFVGPQALPAPPYGSVYTDRDQVVFGESTLALRAWLRRVGIAVENDEVAPEDHIGIMLQLLAWIMRTKPALTDDYLVLHVLTWAPHFLSQLEDAAAPGLYRALAQLANATLTAAQSELGLHVEEPRFYR